MRCYEIISPSTAPDASTSSMLKKPSMTFSAAPSEKCDSRMAYIFNGGKPSKMVAHPVPHSRLGTNERFSTIC